MWLDYHSIQDADTGRRRDTMQAGKRYRLNEIVYIPLVFCSYVLGAGLNRYPRIGFVLFCVAVCPYCIGRRLIPWSCNGLDGPTEQVAIPP